MKFRILYYTTLLASAPVAAMAQTATDAGPASGTGTPGSTVQTNSSSSLSAQDKQFAMAAAQSGLAEVQQGQLATQKGNKVVQGIGQHMVTDHTKANSQLQAIAQSSGLTLPTSPSSDQQKKYQKLQSLSGGAFDSKYLAGQRLAHELAISLFEKEAKNGQAPALKNFATQTLPILREHLKMIKQAQG